MKYKSLADWDKHWQRKFDYMVFNILLGDPLLRERSEDMCLGKEPEKMEVTKIVKHEYRVSYDRERSASIVFINGVFCKCEFVGVTMSAHTLEDWAFMHALSKFIFKIKNMEQIEQAFA